MHHLAIMKKSWGLLPRIISGEKKIESRWYKTRRAPFGKVSPGDTVYFKDSGEPVTIKTKVSKVKYFENLNPKKVKDILNKYGGKDGIGIADINKFYALLKDKKYCMLVYLKDAKKIKPFKIDKTGFGAMSAWISVPNIYSLAHPR